MPTELKPCPFCGGEVKLLVSDSEGNIHNEEYEDDPWSGLGYQLAHYHEDNENCPIASYEDDGGVIGVFIYDSREEAAAAWNRRAE